MRVRATRIGYFNNQRKQVGEVFELIPLRRIKDGKEVIIPPEKQFSKNWMEKVEEKPSGAIQKAQGNPPSTKEVPKSTGDQNVI